MKAFGIALLTTLLFLPSVWASPVIPGLASKHPLSESQVGQLLIGELRCVACHTRREPTLSLERMAPDLADVGMRVSPEFLRKFIASPSAAHAGTTMPEMLANETHEQRDKIAEALTHFLIARSPRQFERMSTDEATAAVGKTLFHSVGCVTCHAPRDAAAENEITKESVIDLDHVPEKYSLTSLGEFLAQPTRVRPSGRMPDMKLTPVEAKAIANYLLGKTAPKPRAFQTEEKLVALGKEQFQRLNCASCHKLGDIPAAKPIGGLKTSDLTRGCLSPKPAKAPHFQLTETQSKAIRSALTMNIEPITDQQRLAVTFTAFNCIGCHKRDEYGGVSENISDYFKTTEKELGDDGRIPPPLTLVGAKLLPVTMKKVLFDGDSVRTYMTTRMPQFGEANLRHLPELLARTDTLPKHDFSVPKLEGRTQQEREREREMRAGGRELVGDKGLYCIACHSVNGKMPNKVGIELMSAPQRLQPSWFYHFVQAPNAFRPRTVMPSSWTKGVSAHKTILNGDADRQIEAIWYYLSLGTSAPDPSGVRSVETLLAVTDAPRTYRGRSSVAGYRGIAVGFPEKLNYAFNAETGTLSALWLGDFIRVNRSGQGSGSFNPATKHAPLAQDLSLYELQHEKTAWPLRPVMTKDAPTNTDPLYPKNLGYQFKGYEMDDASIPTFTYLNGETTVQDRSVVKIVEKKPHLVRTLTFESTKQQTLWFRALTGKVEAESKSIFKTNELRLTIPAVTILLRPIPDAKSSELLLKFEIAQGKSTQAITYELLP
ncbi:c-type cytochrome [soil metagenome]